MKTGWKRALSALLAVAMMAGLLIVPASAAEVTETTTYDFQSNEFREIEGIPKDSAGSFTWTTSTGTVEGSGAYIQSSGNGYGVLLNNGGTLSIPVTGKCNIAVTYRQRSCLKLGDQVAGQNTSDSSFKDTATIHYADWTESTNSVTLTSDGGQSYILSIAVGPYSEAEPTLELGSTGVTLKAEDDPVWVQANVKDAGSADITWTATSGADAVAEALADTDGKVTITPVAAGTATVTVKAVLNGDESKPLTGEVNVVVDEAGDYTEWDFSAKNYWADSERVTIQNKTGKLRGLEIDATVVNAKFDGTQLGGNWVQFNAGTIIKVPVKPPEGGKVKVTVEAYAADTISVDGTTMDATEKTFECDGTVGTVTVAAVAAAYIISIKVEYDESGTVTPTPTPCECGGDKNKCKCADCKCDKCEGGSQGGGDDEVYTSWDFAGDSTLTAGDLTEYKGLVITGGKFADATNGLAFYGEGSIVIPVTGPCDIRVHPSYAWDMQLEGEDEIVSSGKEGATAPAEGVVLHYSGKGPTVTLKALYSLIPNSDPEAHIRTWIKSMALEYPEPVVPSADKRIEVWDLAGKEETDTDVYTNNITATTLTSASWIDGSGKFLQAGGDLGGSVQNKTVDLGGLIFAAGNSDKFYSNVSGLSDYSLSTTADKKYIGLEFADGYTSAGGIFTNGGGTATRRNITIPGVKAGDTVTVYVATNQSDTTYTVDEISDISFLVKSGQFDTLTFIAPKAGSYKVRGDTGKPAYLRVTVAPPVTVSGNITLPGSFDAASWKLKFVDQESKAFYYATVSDGGTDTEKIYTVELPPDRSYVAALEASGWGVTKATQTKATGPAKSDITTGFDWDLEVEAKTLYTYSGTINGFAADYDTSKLSITMVPDEESSNSGSLEVDLDIDETDLSFTAQLEPDVTYSLEMTGVNDYEIKSPTAVTSDGTDNMTGLEIEVGLKALVKAEGKFVVLDPDDQFAPLYADSTYASLTATVTDLKFKNVDDGYTYDATVEDGGYSVKLRAGSYEAVATVDGYKTTGHVVVNNAAVTKDLLFVSTATPAAVTYAADIYVDGVGGTDGHFKTVTGALAYIKRMTSRTDGQRVTVHIAPGTYREQISIDSKNVTFVKDESTKKGEVKLTWYYGIGYTYYSATGVSNLDSWYSAEKAFDRYSKPDEDVARWGCTVRVQASGFQAEGITFENSFNYYLTDEELADGVETRGAKPERDEYLDVTSKDATERAAAIWVDTNNGRGDMTEFKNCRFLSSQDTFGTGKRMYLKDCYIEGMTDYICGPGDVVFDTCTLNWKGYSDSTTGGYVTAPQTGASENGYLFRNCYISGDTDLQLGAGALGRTWGAENTKCVFLNTTLQSESLISNTTWGEMQNFKPEKSTTLLEWGTILPDGTKVDLSKRTLQNTVCESDPVAAGLAYAKPETYFGSDWDPEYYVVEDTTAGVELDAAPTVSDNGDINLPRWGHTLTVSYTLTPESSNANDNSLIQWYLVKDGVETLVKTSNASDKTYYIEEGAAGYHIKVTVTPRTIGGQTGEPMSYTVPEAVVEGFDDPSGKTDPVLGSGVNVYLAGDSTVKDYSVSGMWNKNVLQSEGSWGEWFQQFFSDKVTIVNYAQGGRTTRSFIEDDGSLDDIDKTMKEGDFLFIQFGHNDCYSEDSRYVPLGIAPGDTQKSYAEGGVYPDKTADGATTYTGYLKQYIEVTEKHKATAVLMTPVARKYFNSDGTIYAHHDANVDNTNDNEYCKAVKWVYDWAVDEGYNVLFQDNYQLTVDLFEKAYADCAATDRQTYVKQLFGVNEGTHNNKLGGLIEAAVIAQAIQNSSMTIAKAVQAPSLVQGKTPDGETAFTVSNSGVLTAFDMLSTPAYSEHATYWEGEGQKLFDAIAEKAAELNGGQEEEPDTYSVTVAETTNGTVSANPNQNVAEGTKVSLTIAPESGYELDTLSVKTAVGADVEVAADNTFVMPAANVTVTATFKVMVGQGYTVTVKATENGTVTASPNTGVAANTTVTLTIAPENGYELDTLTVTTATTTKVNDTTYTFVMPAADVTVTATFKTKSGPAPTTYNITVQANNATVDGLPEGNKAEANATITFTVTPDEGYEIVSVAMNGDALTAGEGGYSFTMPAEDVTIEVTTREITTQEVDKTELNKAIEDAETKMGKILTVADNVTAASVTRGQEFITETGLASVKEAIEAAKTIAGKEDATQKEVDDVLAALEKALTDNVKTGTRSTAQSSGGTGSSTGGTTTRPGTTTGATTTTTTSPDGTTTTTTTQTDGTKTETVTKPDGSKTETVTKTDGTTTETVTATDGTVTETVKETNGTTTETITKTDGTVTATKTKADGAKSEKVKEPSGNVTVTATSSSGEVVAKVEIPAVVPELTTKFNDVPSGHWAESAINTMAALSVVQGESNDGQTATFNMDGNITRGAMAQILFNLSQGTEGKAETFADVAEGAWYTDAVAWAADAGVVTGYSDGNFGPNDSITREQLAVMLYRYADLLGLDTAASGSLNSFSDASSVSGWATDAISWAVSKGLIRGKGANNLDPLASATRAETAVIFQRFLDLVK